MFLLLTIFLGVIGSHLRPVVVSKGGVLRAAARGRPELASATRVHEASHPRRTTGHFRRGRVAENMC